MPLRRWSAPTPTGELWMFVVAVISVEDGWWLGWVVDDRVEAVEKSSMSCSKALLVS